MLLTSCLWFAQVRYVTICQAMWRGKMFRKRIHAFDNWDRHSNGTHTANSTEWLSS